MRSSASARQPKRGRLRSFRNLGLVEKRGLLLCILFFHQNNEGFPALKSSWNSISAIDKLKYQQFALTEEYLKQDGDSENLPENMCCHYGFKKCKFVFKITAVKQVL